jgi:hypothetical protein
MQHRDIGPAKQFSPLPSAQPVTPAWKALGTYLPTGVAQRVHQGAHAVPK